MPQYVLVLDAHAMDHIPDEDMPDIDKAAHAVSQEAIEGPPVTVGGLTVIEVPSREDAHKWAAKWAAACRCDQEIWELGFDPKIDAMLRQAGNRKSRPDGT